MKANLLRHLTLALIAVSFEVGAQNMNLVIPPTGALPTGMTKTNYEGATSVPFGPAGQIQTNVRAISTRSTLNDYWVIQYAASQSGFGLTPVKADVYPGVGVYYEAEGLFMKDVGTAGSLKQGSTSLTWGRPSTLTFGAPVTARLEAGNSVNVYMGPTAVDNVLIVKEVASGKVISHQPGSKSSCTSGLFSSCARATISLKSSRVMVLPSRQPFNSPTIMPLLRPRSLVAAPSHHP